MSRILVNNEIDFSEVERILDENGYDYDCDGGNRLIVNFGEADEIVELLMDNDIDVELI